MLDITSRYSSIDQDTLAARDSQGTVREVRYLRRRFIPRAQGTTLIEHQVNQGDRLDIITAQFLGDPTLFWQICDANTVLRPEELERVQRRIEIKLTGVPS